MRRTRTRCTAQCAVRERSGLVLAALLCLLLVLCAARPAPAAGAEPAVDEPRWSSDADGWHWTRCAAFTAPAAATTSGDKNDAPASATCVLRAPGRPGALLQYYVVVCPAEVHCNGIGASANFPLADEPWLPNAAQGLAIELAHHPSGELLTSNSVGWLVRGQVPDALVFGPSSGGAATGPHDRLTWRSPVDPFCPAHDGAGAAACRALDPYEGGPASPLFSPSPPPPGAPNVTRAPPCTSSKYPCYTVAFASAEAALQVTLACGVTDFYGNSLPRNASVGGGVLGLGAPRYMRAPCAAPANASVALFAHDVGAPLAAQLLDGVASAAGGMALGALRLLQWLITAPVTVLQQLLVGPFVLLGIWYHCTYISWCAL